MTLRRTETALRKSWAQRQASDSRLAVVFTAFYLLPALGSMQQ